MRLNEARRDLYRRLAREEGYNSRAAYKLIQAVEKYGFLGPGDRVIDFGAAPGGWLQVASELVGPDGLVVGVDLDKIKGRLGENVATIKADVFDETLPPKLLEKLGGKADVFLSDLSPKVSGVWELDQSRQVDITLRVVSLGSLLLKEGGTLFCKIFEGEGANAVRSRLRSSFREVRVIKPAASRNASSELYYVCDGFVGEPVIGPGIE
jgi:23S rRNA (uridine2552-2'-O)-methyltransferase